MRPHVPALPQCSGRAARRKSTATFHSRAVGVATGAIPIPTFPLIPVTDGEIAELGTGVAGWIVGQRVIPHFIPDWQAGAMPAEVLVARRGLTRPGSLAQYVSVPATSLVAVPQHLDFAQAASLPIAATTAWRAVRAAGLGPGSTALALGTGGVSLFVLQFAKAHGARVIITSSSDEKLERARSLGADVTINYRRTSPRAVTSAKSRSPSTRSLVPSMSRTAERSDRPSARSTWFSRANLSCR